MISLGMSAHCYAATSLTTVCPDPPSRFFQLGNVDRGRTSGRRLHTRILRIPIPAHERRMSGADEDGQLEDEDGGEDGEV